MISLFLISCSPKVKESQSQNNSETSAIENLIEFNNINSDLLSDGSSVLKNQSGDVLPFTLLPLDIEVDDQGIQLIRLQNKERRSSIDMVISEGVAPAGISMSHNCPAQLGRKKFCTMTINIDASSIGVGSMASHNITINNETYTVQYNVIASTKLTPEEEAEGLIELSPAPAPINLGTLEKTEGEKATATIQLRNKSRKTLPVVIDDAGLGYGSMTSTCGSSLGRSQGCLIFITLDSSLIPAGAVAESIIISGKTYGLNATINERSAAEIQAYEQTIANNAMLIQPSSSLDLGSIQQGKINIETIKIYNQSREDISLSIDDSSLNEFAIGSCPSILKRKGTCFLSVSYDAGSASLGAKSESLSIGNTTISLSANIIGENGELPVQDISYLSFFFGSSSDIKLNIKKEIFDNNELLINGYYQDGSIVYLGVSTLMNETACLNLTSSSWSDPFGFGEYECVGNLGDDDFKNSCIENNFIYQTGKGLNSPKCINGGGSADIRGVELTQLKNSCSFPATPSNGGWSFDVNLTITGCNSEDLINSGLFEEILIPSSNGESNGFCNNYDKTLALYFVELPEVGDFIESLACAPYSFFSPSYAGIIFDQPYEVPSQHYSSENTYRIDQVYYNGMNGQCGIQGRSTDNYSRQYYQRNGMSADGCFSMLQDMNSQILANPSAATGDFCIQWGQGNMDWSASLMNAQGISNRSEVCTDLSTITMNQPCTNHPDQSACEGDSNNYCYWDSVESFCMETKISCYDIMENQELCTASGCEFDTYNPGYCSGANEYTPCDMRNDMDCEMQSYNGKSCTWNWDLYFCEEEQTPDPVCENNYQENACYNSTGNCNWDGYNCTAMATCGDHYDQTSCEFDPSGMCYWDGFDEFTGTCMQY